MFDLVPIIHYCEVFSKIEYFRLHMDLPAERNPANYIK